MKKFEGFEKHRRIFLSLSTCIFGGVSVLHIARVIHGWEVVVGGVTLSPLFSVLAAFIAGSMAVMGFYYLMAR